MKKLISTVFIFALICTMALSAGAASIELVNKDVGGDSWDVVSGIWSGPLASGAGELAGVPVIRQKLDDGSIQIISTSDSNVNTADHGIGNYIGIADYIKPNTTYTLTVTVSFSINTDHVLAGSHAVYSRIIADCVFIGADSLTNGSISGQAVAIEDTNGEFVTKTITFTTGASIDPKTVVIVGPGNYEFGENYYWGSFLPKDEFVIKSCLLEGDIVAGQEDKAEVVTEAPVTEAPATEAPATDAPATEAPATDAPATDAPATDAPSTESPSTSDYVSAAIFGAAALAVCLTLVKRKKH